MLRDAPRTHAEEKWQLEAALVLSLAGLRLDETTGAQSEAEDGEFEVVTFGEAAASASVALTASEVAAAPAGASLGAVVAEAEPLRWVLLDPAGQQNALQSTTSILSDDWRFYAVWTVGGDRRLAGVHCARGTKAYYGLLMLAKGVFERIDFRRGNSLQAAKDLYHERLPSTTPQPWLYLWGPALKWGHSVGHSV
jgi:hypothetical protein